MVPEHYQGKGMQCLDAMQACMSEEEIKGFLRGNVIKYIWRYDEKGGLKDLYKAEDYIQMLIKLEEGRNGNSNP